MPKPRFCFREVSDIRIGNDDAARRVTQTGEKSRKGMFAIGNKSGQKY
jgi:hypothetical protein